MTDAVSTPLDRAQEAFSEPRGTGVLPKVAFVFAATGALLWGTWATHTILALRNAAPHLVKIELADLVREFVQHEARSGEPAEEITARTAHFLKAVNGAVSVRARTGDVVLLGNAVVDGNVPDITAAVRAEVYMHQARPTDATPPQPEDSHGAGH